MDDHKQHFSAPRTIPGSSGESRCKAVLSSIRTVAVITAVTMFGFVGLAELSLRIAYSEGMSFGRHTGPYVRRFEQDFRFNRFDGPSRGPEVTGPKGEGVRILIEGDSTTWGEGVRDENALFSSLLRDRLRAVDQGSEVAVLAYPGREIDSHLAELTRWGQEIDPDIIVYQWYINDIELDKTDRPKPSRTWRWLVFPTFITNHSYLWFLLDYRISLWQSQGSYEGYITESFGDDSEKWQIFAEYFRTWAAEAKRLTPNVLVVLYPHILPTGMQFGAFNDRMRVLCEQENIATLDLREPFAVFSDDWTQTYASPFDSHPNGVAHARIAGALYDRIRELWPALIDPGEGPAVAGTVEHAPAPEAGAPGS